MFKTNQQSLATFKSEQGVRLQHTLFSVLTLCRNTLKYAQWATDPITLIQQ